MIIISPDRAAPGQSAQGGAGQARAVMGTKMEEYIAQQPDCQEKPTLDKNEDLCNRVSVPSNVYHHAHGEAPMSLTKQNIAEKIQAKLGFPRNESVGVTESLLELIKTSLESGDDVLVSGFGKFCVKEKKERKGRNPATGEELMLKPRRVVTFKGSGKLRDKVNGK